MSKFRLQECAPYNYWGVTFPERNVKDGVLDRIRHYTFDPKDILVAGFPKSGELRWSLLRMFSTQGSSINGSIFGKRYLLAIDHIMLALFWSYVPNMKYFFDM